MHNYAQVSGDSPHRGGGMKFDIPEYDPNPSALDAQLGDLGGPGNIPDGDDFSGGRERRLSTVTDYWVVRPVNDPASASRCVSVTNFIISLFGTSLLAIPYAMSILGVYLGLGCFVATAILSAYAYHLLNVCVIKEKQLMMDAFLESYLDNNTDELERERERIQQRIEEAQQQTFEISTQKTEGSIQAPDIQRPEVPPVSVPKYKDKGRRMKFDDSHAQRLLSSPAMSQGSDTPRSSYFTLAERTMPSFYGLQFQSIVDGAIALNCAGMAVGMLIVAGDNLPVVAAHLFDMEHGEFLASRYFWVTIFGFFMALPLSFLRTLDKLKLVNIISLLVIMSVVALQVAYAEDVLDPCDDEHAGTGSCKGHFDFGIPQICQVVDPYCDKDVGGCSTQSPTSTSPNEPAGRFRGASCTQTTCTNNGGIWTAKAQDVCDKYQVDGKWDVDGCNSDAQNCLFVTSEWYDILAGIGVLLNAYNATFNIPSIAQELKRTSVSRMSQVVMLGATIATVVYSISAYSTYMVWGHKTDGDVLVSFPHSTVGLLARGLLSIVLCACVPMMVNPSRNSLAHLVFGLEAAEITGWKYYAFTVGLFTCIYGVSISGVPIAIVLGMMGCVVVIPLMMILPPMFYLKMHERHKTLGKYRIFAKMLLAFGAIALPTLTIGQIISIMKSG